MLLRASGEHKREAIDLDAVIGKAEGDGGIPNGAVIAAFAEAVVGDDDGTLAAARRGLLDALGAEALVDSCGVAATFNAIDRVADATGIPIDEKRIEPSADLRDRLGIDRFPSRMQA